MAMVEAGGDGFEFLSIWLTGSPDLAGGESISDVCTADQSSISDVGDATVTVHLDLNSSCEGLTLSARNSEESTAKTILRPRAGRRACAGTLSALEKTLSCYAEKKTDTRSCSQGQL